MAHQIDDQQYYAIKACLERAYAEIQDAFTLLYGASRAAGQPTKGAAPTAPNPGGKQFTPPAPPRVTKDHQAALDEANPEVQAQRAAEEAASQDALQRSISDDVLVVSASANGQGDFFALVQCNNTMQQASIPILEEEYEELQSVTAEDECYITLNQDQKDVAEWEPMRGTSSDPLAQCNCGGHTPNANPYNDPKVDAEIACGHTRKCAFWDFNTITFDQQTGRSCQVELDKVDKSATYGFDIYMNNRREILKRAADPNDPIVLVEGDEDEEEFGFQAILQQASQAMAGNFPSHMVNPPAVINGTDDEDDE